MNKKNILQIETTNTDQRFSGGITDNGRHSERTNVSIGKLALGGL